MTSDADKVRYFNQLLQVVDELRAKCPWDKKQTFATLRLLTIEECHELAEAILNEKPNEIKNELGDLLLHVIFYAKIASEKNLFSITEVCQAIIQKLKKRHPHIYGNIVAKNETEVKKIWENTKRKESSNSLFDGVPRSLPSIIKAYRIQDKSAGIGFDFSTIIQAREKINEELAELDMVTKASNKQHIEDEFGDVMFALVNYARFLNIDPDAALEKTNSRFMKRFKLMEKFAGEQKKSIETMGIKELEKLWTKAKDTLRAN